MSAREVRNLWSFYRRIGRYGGVCIDVLSCGFAFSIGWGRPSEENAWASCASSFVIWVGPAFGICVHKSGPL